LYAGIIVALLLGLAEGGVRTWAFFFRESFARWDPGAGTFLLTPGRHRTELGWVLVNRDGFVGKELEPRVPGLWRIVTLGDSCTFGGGNEVDTYPAMLERRLEAGLPPGRSYEVVNAGISGLNSDLVLRRLHSVVPPLQPDVATIYVGWNDLMKVDPVGQQDSGRWSGVARALDELWLARGLRKLLFYHLRPRLSAPTTGPASDTGRFDGFLPDRYEANLRELVRAVREMEARPLLMTLPTVLRPGMTLEELRSAGVIFPYFASAYGVGDFLDLLGSYNRAVRRVAVEEQVSLVDLARLFDALDDPRAFFYDTMHTNSAGMGLIAGWLEEGLRANHLLGDEPSTAAGGEPDARH
jgi:lysophospholipase L1-like esterase